MSVFFTHFSADHCSAPASELAVPQVATESDDASVEPEVTEAELDSDKQLIYQ